MDQGADKILAYRVQRLPQGVKHGGGGSQNVLKVGHAGAPLRTTQHKFQVQKVKNALARDTVFF